MSERDSSDSSGPTPPHAHGNGAPVYPPGYDPITHTFKLPATAGVAAPAATDPAVCPVDHAALAQSGVSLRPAAGERRTMVVTGASRGIGHSIVRKFAAEGWRIITISRHPFEGARCPWEAGPEDHVQVDLVDRQQLGLAIHDIKLRIGDGPLHALVNNAGISPKGPEGQRLNSLTTPLETWMQVFHVNLLAPILLARGLFDELKRGQGSVVNITSVVGHRVHPFAGTAYATSKAALTALTREMAADFAPHGIRVNAIAPGEIFTDILSPGTEEKFLPLIPMHRLGRPEEVAELVHFLCSAASSYITGEEININGGQLL
ncbi:SDR family oxidoreductase [Siculibacillus lacustris]|uniref:SDR family oxidoreductase n=1 Tax=Siculibacillus lacustris TaxID=1549641 RepID=A0A4Q9VQA2_9HYPH|nr:SDR family oxidoreductase [Siculibacillus lacustris]TBW37997.1 SDR family oxidoreductase [Siculibacillus lacustris]